MNLSASGTPASTVVRRQRNLVVLGFSLVGKTAICQRFCNDMFDDRYEPTYVNSFSKVVHHGGMDVECVIKDTQGDGGESVFRNEYGLGHHGYILVYSVTSRRSLDTLRAINDRLVNLIGTDRVPKVLVANKSDLEDQRQVSASQGLALSDEWKCAFTECSAKENHNVDQVFKLLLREIDKAYEAEDNPDTSRCPDWKCACFPSSKQRTEEDSLGIDKFKLFFWLSVPLIWLTLVFGAAVVAIGLYVGTADTSSAPDRTDLLSYVLFGFGLITFLVSILGLVGSYHRSKEFTFVYSVSQMIVLAAETVVFFTVIWHMDLVQHNSAWTTPFTATFGTLQLVASVAAYLQQQHISSTVGADDASSLSYSRLQHPNSKYDTPGGPIGYLTPQR